MAVAETTAPTSNHDASGRFVRGNRGGPGNPLGGRIGEMRQIIVDALTNDAVRKLADAMIERAQDGNVAAARLLLQYALGRPAAAADLERFDCDDRRQPPAPAKATEPIASCAPPPETVRPPIETNAAPNAGQPERTSRANRKAMKRALRDLRRGHAPSANGSIGGDSTQPAVGARSAPNRPVEPVRAS
jgi:hypothetical protein